MQEGATVQYANYGSGFVLWGITLSNPRGDTASFLLDDATGCVLALSYEFAYDIGFQIRQNDLWDYLLRVFENRVGATVAAALGEPYDEAQIPIPDAAQKMLGLRVRGTNTVPLRLLNAGIALCIEGETGSGKEYVSRTLHRHSRWRSGKFVAINCAAIPESLIESELFGYQPGAFTGASKNGYIGKIREADGGVLFLDEIGDMPLALQTRLLRVLQEKEVAPLGASRSVPVNFALICATHRNLTQRVSAGEFREDLLWRLREYALALPPLREWPALETFIATLWHDLGGASRRVTLSNALLVHLSQLPWPGNVRQLQSVLKVMLALADEGDTLTPDALPEAYRAAPAPLPRGGLQAHDEQLIVDTLARVNGNVSRAAQMLGIARSTLYRRAARAGRPRR